MTRLAPLAASVAVPLLLLFAPAAVSAQPNGQFYSARPVNAPSVASLVVRDTIWKCGGEGCASATRGKSRPAFVCESLAREVGELASFRAGDKEFDAEALAKCNSRG